MNIASIKIDIHVQIPALHPTILKGEDQMKKSMVILCAIMLMLSLGSFVNAASFMSLGDLEGGSYFSRAMDVSADGSVVIGEGASSLGDESFRWTKSQGIEGLGFVGQAYAVSSDGSVIVGHSVHRAFRWTEAQGMENLGSLTGGYDSEAWDVSSDGSVVVGLRDSDDGLKAFRWTQAQGMEDLEDFPGGDNKYARGVSSDGSVIVGGSNTDEGMRAFRWTGEGGMEDLGTLTGWHNSEAWDVSSDGSVVVGVSETYSWPEAFRWTEEGGMEGLGSIPGGGHSSIAYGVSSDGSVIVGMSGYTNSGNKAFIWDHANGMQSLQDVLIDDYFLDLTGWELLSAYGCSSDGLTIVGYGINPDGYNEAWIAELHPNVEPIPEPTTILLIGSGLVGLAGFRRKFKEA